jgi:Tat protein secretion system quality control protein TatD with DNase activity
VDELSKAIIEIKKFEEDRDAPISKSANKIVFVGLSPEEFTSAIELAKQLMATYKVYGEKSDG